MSLAEFDADFPHLAFRHRQTGNGHQVRLKAGLAIEPVEALRGAPDDGREQDVRPLLFHLGEYRVQVGGRRFHRNIDLARDFTAVGGDEVTHDPVRFPRINVIGPDQKYPLAIGPDQIFGERKAVLVR